jgi:hypothetical protein
VNVFVEVVQKEFEIYQKLENKKDIKIQEALYTKP